MCMAPALAFASMRPSGRNSMAQSCGRLSATTSASTSGVFAGCRARVWPANAGLWSGAFGARVSTGEARASDWAKTGVDMIAVVSMVLAIRSDRARTGCPFEYMSAVWRSARLNRSRCERDGDASAGAPQSSLRRLRCRSGRLPSCDGSQKPLWQPGLLRRRSASLRRKQGG